MALVIDHKLFLGLCLFCFISHIVELGLAVSSKLLLFFKLLRHRVLCDTKQLERDLLERRLFKSNSRWFCQYSDLFCFSGLFPFFNDIDHTVPIPFNMHDMSSCISRNPWEYVKQRLTLFPTAIRKSSTPTTATARANPSVGTAQSFKPPRSIHPQVATFADAF